MHYAILGTYQNMLLSQLLCSTSCSAYLL